MTKTNKFYLQCSYAEKNQCKALGGQWDPVRKQWFAPSHLDPEIFTKWWPKQYNKKESDIEETIDEAVYSLQEDVEDLREELKAYVIYDEQDHYEPPKTPEEIFRREIGEWKDWKKTSPAFFKNCIREDLDTETLAFFYLPSDVKNRLLN